MGIVEEKEEIKVPVGACEEKMRYHPMRDIRVDYTLPERKAEGPVYEPRVEPRPDYRMPPRKTEERYPRYELPKRQYVRPAIEQRFDNLLEAKRYIRMKHAPVHYRV